MSPKKKEIAPRHAKKHVGEERSSQNAPIIQDLLQAILAIYYQRSGSISRPRLVARLTRELGTVTANVRTISQQNASMRKLLGYMQGQLANSSQNEEVVSLEREVDVDMVTDYVTGGITEETVVPLECSKANV
ncbi:Hypothetical predicted protein [Olea europaea subsp. europaea]|uniref:Uncharacterized protein n=1 Tax=Olea europaea subsp. europaea TaxID=158383 RepID=A0A8S0SQN0_OLEEU|nr:Hypothetical predicted protein [Olea europaea subsp. europaea]